jgi:hypothetical protein
VELLGFLPLFPAAGGRQPDPSRPAAEPSTARLGKLMEGLVRLAAAVKQGEASGVAAGTGADSADPERAQQLRECQRSFLDIVRAVVKRAELPPAPQAEQAPRDGQQGQQSQQQQQGGAEPMDADPELEEVIVFQPQLAAPAAASAPGTAQQGFAGAAAVAAAAAGTPSAPSSPARTISMLGGEPLQPAHTMSIDNTGGLSDDMAGVEQQQGPAADAPAALNSFSLHPVQQPMPLQRTRPQQLSTDDEVVQAGAVPSPRATPAALLGPIGRTSGANSPALHSPTLAGNGSLRPQSAPPAQQARQLLGNSWAGGLGGLSSRQNSGGECLSCWCGTAAATP